LLEVGPAKIRAHESRRIKLGSDEVRSEEIGPFQIDLAEDGSVERRPGEVGDTLAALSASAVLRELLHTKTRPVLIAARLDDLITLRIVASDILHGRHRDSDEGFELSTITLLEQMRRSLRRQ